MGTNGTRARWLSVTGALVVLAVGCANGDAEEAPSDAEVAESIDLTERPDVASLVAQDRGDPPDELERVTVVSGDGAEARPGTVVTVQYVGVAWSSGETFAASWDHGQPFTFELGAGEVIPGWELGVAGMRVGGRTVLTIPPDLAYGDTGSPGVIEPGETLVFVVDLLDVDEPG